MLARAESCLQQQPRRRQALDGCLHGSHGHLQRAGHVREGRECLAPPVGAPAEVGIHREIPCGQKQRVQRQPAPAAPQIPQLIGMGDLLAVAVAPGAHGHKALLDQPGNGSAHRVFAHAAPFLDRGAAHCGRAQAVLAGRQVHVDLQFFGLQSKIKERII